MDGFHYTCVLFSQSSLIFPIAKCYQEVNIMLFTLYIWSSASAQPATDSYLKQFQCVAAKAGGSNTEISGNVLPSMPQAG